MDARRIGHVNGQERAKEKYVKNLKQGERILRSVIQRLCILRIYFQNWKLSNNVNLSDVMDRLSP